MQRLHHRHPPQARPHRGRRLRYRSRVCRRRACQPRMQIHPSLRHRRTRPSPNRHRPHSRLQRRRLCPRRRQMRALQNRRCQLTLQYHRRVHRQRRPPPATAPLHHNQHRQQPTRAPHPRNRVHRRPRLELPVPSRPLRTAARQLLRNPQHQRRMQARLRWRQIAQCRSRTRRPLHLQLLHPQLHRTTELRQALPQRRAARQRHRSQQRPRLMRACQPHNRVRLRRRQIVQCRNRTRPQIPQRRRLRTMDPRPARLRRIPALLRPNQHQPPRRRTRLLHRHPKLRRRRRLRTTQR
jgi:hypothetical protein